MHIDWPSLGQVAVVSIGVAAAVVVIFSLGVLALSHRDADTDRGNTTTLALTGALLCDAPKITGNATTLRAYAGVLDRVANTALDRTNIAQLGGASAGEHRHQGRIALPGQLVVARRRW